MPAEMPDPVTTFISRWQGVTASELSTAQAPVRVTFPLGKMGHRRLRFVPAGNATQMAVW